MFYESSWFVSSEQDAQPGFNIRDYIKAISSDIPVVEALWRPKD
jgi:hypothetical protein